MAQVTLNTRLSQQLNDALELYAAKIGKSKASIVEAAVAAYLAKQAK
jgi:predicted transcriptional regulator